MSKFVIENIIIEKSDKDISTGVKYEFSSGLNLICGNNEAGKSSLMKFIKEGFFRPIKTDKGKIFFSVYDNDKKESYRADIQNHQKKDKRCQLFDGNNSPLEYSIIEKLINQKYYEQGFTINIDDLMNLQYDNNMSLVNVIKDPSGDKLNSSLQKINSKISEYIGLNGKPKKTVTEITDKISQLNMQINELSQKETQYNNSILNIQESEDEIQKLNQQEEYINILILLNKENSETDSIKEHLKCIYSEFNPKLYNHKDKYIDILQNTGKYESNIDTINRDKQKLESINNKLNADITRLNMDFSINPSEDELNNFVIDYDKINRIKELIQKSENADIEVKSYQKSIEDIENTILKLKNDLEALKNNKDTEYPISKLEQLFNIINEGMKQYKFLSIEINNINQKVKVNAKSIFSNNNSMILFATLLLLTISCAVVSFIQNVPSAGIFAILMTILISIGFGIQKLGSYNDYQNNDKMRKQTQQEAILQNLIKEVKEYYPEIENVESSYLPSKIDDLKQEINNKLLENKTLNDKIAQNESDIKFNESKKENINNKLAILQEEIESYKRETENIIKSDNAKFILPAKKYIEASELIKNIKNEISEKISLNKEIYEIENINNEIINKFNNFILETDININLSSNLKENTEKLRLYSEANYKLKQQIDIYEVSIENIKERINKYEEAKAPYIKKFKEINANIDLINKLEEINLIRKEKQNLKKENEFQKRELEDFEGITDLKNQRNILLNELKDIIKSLYINKTILTVTETARNNFDKTQPDLINAQRYLSLLTDDKYNRINLNTEEIISSDGCKIKKWDELSRGTKEQLYLALRLGFASNYTKDKTTLKDNGRADLPVIIDDAFVNFDYKRTHNAIKCLIEFSKTNQVLFFTCHTNIIKQHLEELGLKEKDNFNFIYIN